jgi:hypothetical protein
MAENNLEKPSFFSIENTMEMGMGSAELLQDLMTPESASTNPDDVEPIVEKVKDDKPIVPEKKAKV